MMRCSFINLAAPASIAASTTFADAAHPATNALAPQRPFLRAWSANTTAQRLTIDFGSAKALDVIALIHVNTALVTIQGHASDTWGAPSYSQAVTVAVSPNDRYHHGQRSSGFAYRYLSLSIPSQTPVDGASVFKIGGIWAGAIVSPPRDIRDTPDEEKLESRLDVTTSDGRILQRLILDDPAWHVTANRQAENEPELAAWRAIDRQWSAAAGQYALVLMRDARPEETWVMRQISPSKWAHAKLWSESQIELQEVISA